MGHFFPNHKMHWPIKKALEKVAPAGQKTKRFQADDELSGYHRKNGVAESRSEIGRIKRTLFTLDRP